MVLLGDAFFGDNHCFNETLFVEVIIIFLSFKAGSKELNDRLYSLSILAIALGVVNTTSLLQGNSDIRGSRILSPPILNFLSSHPVLLLHTVKLYFQSSFL